MIKDDLCVRTICSKTSRAAVLDDHTRYVVVRLVDCLLQLLTDCALGPSFSENGLYFAKILPFPCRYVLLNVESGSATELFKSSAICMTRLSPADELLVAKGNVGTFLLASGRVSRRLLIWSDMPAAMAYSQPYAIAFFSGYVEIRSAHYDSGTNLAQVSLHSLRTFPSNYVNAETLVC